MKIQLQAFGYLKSDVMIWPESTDFRVKLALVQPIVTMMGEPQIPLQPVATFTWKGKVENGARIYDLEAIDKHGE